MLIVLVLTSTALPETACTVERFLRVSSEVRNISVRDGGGCGVEGPEPEPEGPGIAPFSAGAGVLPPDVVAARLLGW